MLHTHIEHQDDQLAQLKTQLGQQAQLLAEQQQIIRKLSDLLARCQKLFFGIDNSNFERIIETGV